MNRARLLAPEIELAAHHEFEVAARLDGAEVVRGGHDVLRENVDPLKVLLPFGFDLSRARGRWCEQRAKELGVGDKH